MAPTRARRGAAVLCGALLVSALVGAPTASAAILPCGTSRPDRDLNGDDYPDAVVGDPYATVAGQAEAGAVTVLFGDADGRIGEGARRTLTQTDFGETPEAGDHFGWALTVEDTSSGGCDGIFIGAPGEDVAGSADAGMAHIVTLNVTAENEPPKDTFTTIDQSDLAGTVEAGDEFGYSVIANGGNSEEEISYAFGAPGENNDGGVVNISEAGYPFQDRQGTRGIPGTLQAGDRFGETLVKERITSDPLLDEGDFPFAVGAPGETVNGRRGAGSVTDISGRGRPGRVFTQDSPGVPGTAEAGDHFGASLAGNPAAVFQVDPSMVAVGSPGEDIGSAADAGSVTVFKRIYVGSVERTLPTVGLSQNTTGVAGTVEAGDQFGAAVAYRDGRTLAVGVPGENVGSVADAGSAQIIRVGRSNLGFPSPTLTEDSPGTPGAVSAGSRFGSGVFGLHRNLSRPGGESVFAISSRQGGGSVYVLSDDADTPPRSWKPGSGGITGTGVRFGQSVD